MMPEPYGQSGYQPPWGGPGSPRGGVPAAPSGGHGYPPPPQWPTVDQQQGYPGGLQQPVYPPGYEQAWYQQPPMPPSPPKKRSAMPWLFGSLLTLIIVAAVAVLGFVTPGWFLRTVFDSAAVEQGVQQILRDSYKLGAVNAVHCPVNVPVEESRTFDCQIGLGDKQRSVTVTVKDERGAYAVGYPK